MVIINSNLIWCVLNNSLNLSKCIFVMLFFGNVILTLSHNDFYHI